MAAALCTLRCSVGRTFSICESAPLSLGGSPGHPSNGVNAVRMDRLSSYIHTAKGARVRSALRHVRIGLSLGAGGDPSRRYLVLVSCGLGRLAYGLLSDDRTATFTASHFERHIQSSRVALSLGWGGFGQLCA